MYADKVTPLSLWYSMTDVEHTHTYTHKQFLYSPHSPKQSLQRKHWGMYVNTHPIANVTTAYTVSACYSTFS